ncbi:MAG: hypothetical protein PHW24_05195 [Candidatus Moranbacteria bacterium]|nr:hypothetical protein [Candidatus Moranbacteria bacterium]
MGAPRTYVINPDCAANMARLGERLENTVSIQADIVKELHELRKQVNGNGKPGLQDLIAGNSKQITDIINWKKEADKKTSEVKTENSRYIWAIVIMSLSSIMTILGNIVIAWYNSKGTIP